jgi:hypothetical protein
VTLVLTLGRDAESVLALIPRFPPGAFWQGVMQASSRRDY